MDEEGEGSSFLVVLGKQASGEKGTWKYMTTYQEDLVRQARW